MYFTYCDSQYVCKQTQKPIRSSAGVPGCGVPGCGVPGCGVPGWPNWAFQLFTSLNNTFSPLTY